MGRLIDTDDLYNELKKLVDEGCGEVLQEEFETVMFFVDCYSETVCLTPKWISTEERVPNVFDLVIVHYENGEIDCACRFPVTGFLHKETKGRVTHWMPLPEPPETET